MKILVVEDRFNDMEYICGFLEELAPKARILKAGDVKTALNFICEDKIDLAFIDVDLPDESGFAFASKLRKMREYRMLNIVFVTGTNENPLRAHREYHCYDFIKKPYTKKAFQKIVEPLIEACSEDIGHSNKTANEESKIILLKSGQEMHVVEAEDIVFAEITGRDVTVHCMDKVLGGIRMKFEDFIKYVNLDTFVRCHKSYAVNTKKIEGIVNVNYRLWEIKFEDAYHGDKKCMMSKVYRGNVEQCLFQRT